MRGIIAVRVVAIVVNYWVENRTLIYKILNRKLIYYIIKKIMRGKHIEFGKTE